MLFDRELKNEYYITVLAVDGAPSNRTNHYPPGTPNQGNKNTPNQGEGLKLFHLHVVEVILAVPVRDIGALVWQSYP